MVSEINHVTPGKHKSLVELYQHHESQQLQDVGTNTTGPKSTFAKQQAQINTAAEDDIKRVAQMTADKCIRFHVSLSNS